MYTCKILGFSHFRDCLFYSNRVTWMRGYCMDSSWTSCSLTKLRGWSWILSWGLRERTGGKRFCSSTVVYQFTTHARGLHQHLRTVFRNSLLREWHESHTSTPHPALACIASFVCSWVMNEWQAVKPFVPMNWQTWRRHGNPWLIARQSEVQATTHNSHMESEVGSATWVGL